MTNHVQFYFLMKNNGLSETNPGYEAIASYFVSWK